MLARQNVGGGGANSTSLRELTSLCGELAGRRVDIGRDPRRVPRIFPSMSATARRYRGEALGGHAAWLPMSSAILSLADRRTELA